MGLHLCHLVLVKQEGKLLARPQLDAPTCYQLTCCWEFKAHLLLLCNHIVSQLASEMLHCLPAAGKIKGRKQPP